MENLTATNSTITMHFNQQHPHSNYQNKGTMMGVNDAVSDTISLNQGTLMGSSNMVYLNVNFYENVSRG